MFLKLQLIGSGDPGDDWRVDLASYTMLSADYVDRWAIVSIPVRDNPPTLPPTGSPLWETIDSKVVLIGLEMPHLLAWYDRLAGRYPAPVGPFTPSFA